MSTVAARLVWSDTTILISQRLVNYSANSIILSNQYLSVLIPFSCLTSVSKLFISCDLDARVLFNDKHKLSCISLFYLINYFIPFSSLNLTNHSRDLS